MDCRELNGRFGILQGSEGSGICSDLNVLLMFFYWRSPDGELSCGLTCPLYMFMVFVHICACVGHKETFFGAWWARPPTLGPGRKPSGAFKDNVQWDLMVAGRRVLQTCTSDGYTRALDVDGGWWICLEPVVVGKNAWEKKNVILWRSMVFNGSTASFF